jgi:hypothetical protein
MASITYWSQLQPSPRDASIATSLAACVRDPAWMLSRQWQLGEFAGADAGSPAFVRITARTAKLTAVQVGGSSVSIGDGQLLEAIVEPESLGPDLATRVEIGQTFESLVSTAVRDLFLDAYRIGPADDATDPATARFLAICAGRAVDGVALYIAAKQAQQANHPLPDRPVVPLNLQADAKAGIATFVRWVETTWGPLGTDEPPLWDPARLEYRSNVTGGGLTLEGRPDGEAALDWHCFDLVAGTPASTPAPPTSVFPGHVRFRGMPNARWWDFETSKTDFGALLPDPRDLAKLLFADFMLLHGDDWYLAPLDVPAGSLCWIDTLDVTDIFGVKTNVPRADATPGPPWTVFSTTDRTKGGFAPFLLVPASAAAASITSDAIEEVHLLRDETADIGWAIEHIVEGPAGVSRQEALPPPSGPPADAPAPLVYQLATPLPPSWFPLLPVQADRGAIALVAATVDGGPQRASGRFVQRFFAPGFQLPEEEIGRAGVRLQRIASRTRLPDGKTKLWIARRKQIGAGEASSSLRYDQAQRVDTPS